MNTRSSCIGLGRLQTFFWVTECDPGTLLCPSELPRSPLFGDIANGRTYHPREHSLTGIESKIDTGHKEHQPSECFAQTELREVTRHNRYPLTIRIGGCDVCHLYHVPVQGIKNLVMEIRGSLNIRGNQGKRKDQEPYHHYRKIELFQRSSFCPSWAVFLLSIIA